LVKVNYQDLVNHINITCVKNKIQCDNANQGCTELIARDEMQEHILNCEFGIIQCEECGLLDYVIIEHRGNMQLKIHFSIKSEQLKPLFQQKQFTH
jgi:hypothetical protein